jgi:hypothetical protein
MSKKWTHAACFAFFGTTPANPRWSWSARNSDTKTVVLTLWQDEFEGVGKGQMVYQPRPRIPEKDWAKRPGNRERLENLKWARENCEGLFRVIIAKAKDVNGNPREIEECFPQEKLLMRITRLDEESGEFRAESVAQK